MLLLYYSFRNHICIQYIWINIGLVGTVSANSAGDRRSIPGHVIPKTQKMVLDFSLLNAQHFKVRIQGKVEQSRERSSVLGVVAIEKGAFGLLSTKGDNFTYLYMCCIVTTNYTHIHAETKSTIMTNEHASLEKKYTSHTLFEMVAKGLYVRGELETEQTTTYWPPSSSVFSSTSFSFCWATQSGVLRAHSPLLGAGSLYSILSPTDSKLTELPVAPGYITVWHPPAFRERRICTQFNPSTVKVIPWYLRPDAPVPWLTAGSKVNMLHIYKQDLALNNPQVLICHKTQLRRFFKE